MTWFAIWMLLRVLRWASWIGFVVFLAYIHVKRASILTALSQLPIAVEVSIYGLAVAAIAFGMLELAAREKAGLDRPPFLRMPRRVGKRSA